MSAAFDRPARLVAAPRPLAGPQRQPEPLLQEIES